MEDRKSIDEQVPHVAVGCPGRIFDLIRRRFLNVSKLRIIVIDEADEMLSKGFQEQIRDIFQMLPHNVQVGIFSATLTKEVLDLTPNFMNNPVKITMAFCARELLAFEQPLSRRAFSAILATCDPVSIPATQHVPIKKVWLVE